MDKIKVIIWGCGAMGSGIAGMLLRKKGVEICGLCDCDPRMAGKTLSQLTGTVPKDYNDLPIQTEIKDILTEKNADLAFLTTDSFTRKAFPKIQYLLEHRLNVITTAEEMAYPAATEPELTDRLDRLARKNRVTLLGTGINPGFILDLLVITLTGACMDVEQIEAERINDLAPFGPAVMKEQGIGLTETQFQVGVRSGSVAGHVGFPQSIAMIAHALGWLLSGPASQSISPIISAVFRQSPHAEVKAGEVAGCLMKGMGKVGDQEKILLSHPQQIAPEREGIETGDFIHIRGTPEISLSIKPEIPGGIGTIALCVNMIPHVLNAEAGLKTMIDLPVPRAVLGDMRNLISK